MWGILLCHKAESAQRIKKKKHVSQLEEAQTGQIWGKLSIKVSMIVMDYNSMNQKKREIQVHTDINT